MTVSSAEDIVSNLSNCSRLKQFLEKDLKSRNEVGFYLGEDGTIFEFREGKWNELNIILPSEDSISEKRIMVHTHPSIDATDSGDLTVSESDLSIGEHPAICGLVVLSQEMFDVEWQGKAIFFGENGKDVSNFRIKCEGTTDGPASERWIKNPKIKNFERK